MRRSCLTQLPRDTGLAAVIALSSLPIPFLPGRASAGDPAGLLGRWALASEGVAFDGRGPPIEAPSSPALELGTRDFSISAWVHTPEELDDRLGDLASKLDVRRRRGFVLGLRTLSGVTTSQPNHRTVAFGLDNGAESAWTDCGRPGNAVFVFALAVHDGGLYAGTCEPGPGEAGRAYRYEGGARWRDLGPPDGSNAVSALAVHAGRLHAGTAKYRLAGSSLPESANPLPGGGVYRLEGERWADCGRLPGAEAVGGLAVYRGRLYASSLYRPAGFFRHEGGTTWASCGVPGGKRVVALGVHDGLLYATSYDEARVFGFDGTSWSDCGLLGENTQTYSLAVFGGALHVGTWPSGRVYRRATDGSWSDAGRLGDELEVMGMLPHNGSLYAGTLPSGDLYRLDGERWTRVGSVDATAGVKYRRAWTMAEFQGKLFVGTLPSGRVRALQAGPCVTLDRELAPGWRHLAAVKEGGLLKLYVDGKIAATSGPFDLARFDLTNAEPLRIGSGPHDHFLGRLRDVRLYGRALAAAEVEALGRAP